jgi:hypothetical protein
MAGKLSKDKASQWRGADNPVPFHLCHRKIEEFSGVE